MPTGAARVLACSVVNDAVDRHDDTQFSYATPSPISLLLMSDAGISSVCAGYLLYRAISALFLI